MLAEGPVEGPLPKIPQTGEASPPQRGNTEPSDEAYLKEDGRNRATALEKEERIERTIQLLGNLGYNNRVGVYKALQEEFRLKVRQAEQYVAWAQERIREHTRKPTNQHREEMLIALDSIIHDLQAQSNVRLLALKQKARLLGLNVPLRDELQDPSEMPFARANDPATVTPTQ